MEKNGLGTTPSIHLYVPKLSFLLIFLKKNPFSIVNYQIIITFVLDSWCFVLILPRERVHNALSPRQPTPGWGWHNQRWPSQLKRAFHSWYINLLMCGCGNGWERVTTYGKGVYQKRFVLDTWKLRNFRWSKTKQRWMSMGYAISVSDCTII